ncbi:hypothetical protein ACH4U5_39145 [Streptomyces sp. NPDC020858]|uniref:hypothetical protein n=1 Tax=Streptomyces sp. NPDC020858 TaxID=3365097 RepID=UPI00379ADCEB
MARAESARPESLSVLGLHSVKQADDDKLLAVVTRRMTPPDPKPDHAATAQLTVFIRRNRMATHFSEPGMVLKEVTVTPAAGEVAAAVLVDVVPAAGRKGREPRATITTHLSDPRSDGPAAALSPGTGPLSGDEYRHVLEGADAAAVQAEEILKRYTSLCLVPGVEEMRARVEGLGTQDRTYAAICDTLRGMLDEWKGRAESSGRSWSHPYLPVHPFIQILAEYGVLGQHGPPSDAASAQHLDGLLRDHHDRLLFAAHFDRRELDFREQHHLDRRLIGGGLTRNMVIGWD